METEKLVLKDVEEIKKIVSSLSGALNQAGVDWKDSMYSAFVSSLAPVTAKSREFMKSADIYRQSLNRFVSASNM